MNRKPPRRYVIIGSGVAGIAAMQAIRSRDAQGEIRIISDDPYGYYSRPGLAYYLTGELGQDSLFPISKKELREYAVLWHTSQVTRIFPGEHQVELDHRARLGYDRLLIATGSMASPLAVSGADNQGVHKLDNLSDANAILKTARRARRAVVVGGGITALELVEGLRARGLQVHFFLRGDRYWNNVLDETESRIIEDRLKQEGVSIHYHAELAEVETRAGKTVGVVTREGRKVPCELVAGGIGVQPRAELAKPCGLAVERGIVTDQYMASSQPDIYAAGDVAQAYDPYSGKTVLDTLWNPARSQGQAAGLNMAGGSEVYQKYIAYNVTRLAGLTTTIIGSVGRGADPSLVGIGRGDSETWRMLPDAIIAESSQEVNRLRLVIGEKKLLGAILIGDQALSIPLQELIARQVDISSIRSALMASDRLGERVVDFWKTWRANSGS